jgi:putative membrane protein (TIGR04086 family)
MRLRWLRIVIAGVVAELALFLVIPLNFLPGGAAILQVIVIPACLLTTFLGGWWAARKATGNFALHGLLVGALAAIIYAGLAMAFGGGEELPATYVAANWLKLAGGAAGGWFAGRRAAAARPA